MRRRPALLFFAAAALLVLAAAIIVRQGESRPASSDRVEVEFPRQMRPAERRRMRARLRPAPQRQFVPPPPVAGEPAPPLSRLPDPPLRDPVLAAFPATPGASAFVVEANALRHSALGEWVIDCFGAAERERLEKFREEVGVDPLEGIDRVAFGDGAAIATGQFGGIAWDRLIEGRAPRAYGPRGRIYEMDEGAAVGVLGDEMIVTGRDVATVERMLDRVEGRGPAGDPPPLLGAEDAYGEVYGVFAGEALGAVLAAVDGALGERFREAVGRAELHVDAARDLAMVADVNGADPQRMEELSRALGGALAAARAAARAEGEDDLAALLDHARVVPQGGRFSLELALPFELLKSRLPCGGSAP